MPQFAKDLLKQYNLFKNSRYNWILIAVVYTGLFLLVVKGAITENCWVYAVLDRWYFLAFMFAAAAMETSDRIFQAAYMAKPVPTSSKAATKLILCLNQVVGRKQTNLRKIWERCESDDQLRKPLLLINPDAQIEVIGQQILTYFVAMHATREKLDEEDPVFRVVIAEAKSDTYHRPVFVEPSDKQIRSPAIALQHECSTFSRSCKTLGFIMVSDASREVAKFHTGRYHKKALFAPGVSAHDSEVCSVLVYAIRDYKQRPVYIVRISVDRINYFHQEQASIYKIMLDAFENRLLTEYYTKKLMEVSHEREKIE